MIDPKAIEAARYHKKGCNTERGAQYPCDCGNPLRQSRRASAQPQQTPVAGGGQKLWLWKNFVDGRPEYWAFDNPFPTYGGDPVTFGQPCGYAVFKQSMNGRPDVSDETVIADIRAAKE